MQLIRGTAGVWTPTAWLQDLFLSHYAMLCCAGAPRTGWNAGQRHIQNPIRGEELGDRRMNTAGRQDGRVQPAGRSKIPLLHKPGSTQLRPLPNPQCLTQDSGQLFTYFVGETASSENMTFAQNFAGQQESLPGTALLSRGPNPCPAARSGHRGSGSARRPVPHTAVVEKGEGLLF